MGQFRYTFQGVAGHGCHREAKDGEAITVCEDARCLDCKFARLSRELISSGMIVEVARLEHWPETPGTVTDDHKTGLRKGQF